MSFTSQSIPEKLYYDVVVTNLETKNNPPPILYFNETRNNPFIYDPEKYWMSIIRFTIDTPTLPIFIPSIQPYSADLNLTIYSVTLEYTIPQTAITFTQETFVQFIPQDKFATVPVPPSQTTNGLQNNNSAYYYIYNYQYWIYLVNIAFTTCFNSLAAQIAAYNLANATLYTLPTTYAPLFNFDTTANIAILTADIAGYSTGQISIWLNPSLFQLFSSFPVLVSNLALNANNYGKAVQIQMDSFQGANTIQYPPNNPTYTAIQVFQEYSTISLWNPVTSVVFCSNTIPIVPNQLSTPLLFVDGNIISNSGNNSNISQVITDFVADGGQYKPSIVYNPSAQYRLVELVGNRPLNNLDVYVYWKDRTGALQPFRLSSGSTATIKFLFTRKGEYSNYK
jgi:hypothetical protein